MHDASPEMMSIFGGALERSSAEERAAYLDAACGQDAALRGRVEALLRAHAEAGGFFNPGATVDQPPVAGAGTRVGPYQLLEPLGEGGMGTVWLAQQQEPVRRLVAVKLIKAGMDSKAVLARFEAERQALALMDHPHIAKVFDAGTTADGRPFFVMELVRGVPLTRYCDERRLTVRQRLEPFVPVCAAIQHAHQKGVIHRDIKPSNVLVALYDDRPVPKVIDFGIAKATGQQLTEETLQTGLGAVVGTPEYMSPEQAGLNALDVDTRSDVYALGVLLYELLAGSPPFSRKQLEKAGVLEMLRVIREQEPQKPSTKLSTAEGLPALAAQRGTEPVRLTRLVRGELDWIVLKALEKDRARRYETATGLAMDVQRYLADEPVLACPPSAGYRLRKFARRNKTGLAVAGLVLAFLVTLGGGAGWTVRDREAREQEVAREAARKLALTEEGIRQALGRAGKSRGDLHAALEKPGGVRELLNQPARWELSIKTAQAELAQARRLQARAEGDLDAEVTEALARLEQQVAADEADYRLARHLEKIRQDRATLVKDYFDDRTALQEYRKAFAGFGVLARNPEAAAARLAASPIKEQLVATVDDWALLAFRQPDLARQLLRVSRHAAPDAAWGDRLRQLKVWRDQEALGRLAAEAPARGLSPQLLNLVGYLLRKDEPLRVRWLRRAQTQHPADFWLAFDLASALLVAKKYGEAEGLYRVALAIRPTSTAAWTNLGNALRDQGKLDECAAVYRKATEIDPRSALAYNNLGIALRNQGKLDEAVTACRKAIDINPKFAHAYDHLGVLLVAQGKLDAAVAAYRKAIDINPKHASAYNNLGNALRNQGKLDAAVAAYRKAIDSDPKHASAYHNLGIALGDQGRLDEAIAAYRKAIDIDPKLAPAYNGLGNALRDQGRLDEAIAAYRKAIDIDPKFAPAYNGLGVALRDQGKLDEAIAVFRKAIDIDPKFVQAYSNLGIALFNQGKLDEAIAVFRKAIDIDPKFAPAYNHLGAVLAAQGKLDEAVAAFRKAIVIDPKLASAYSNLGTALRNQGKLDEAAAAFRKAIDINPKNAQAYDNLGTVLVAQGKLDEAVAAYRKATELGPGVAEFHCNLGMGLLNLGQFAQALEALQRGHALGNKRPDWRYPTARWVEQCERLLALEKRLPDVLAGKAAGPVEQLNLAALCLRYLKRYRDGAWLLGKAFAAEPKLAEDLDKARRFDAARAAALAAAGEGAGADKLAPADKARLRGQALDWLRADLTARGKLLADNPAAAGPVRKALQTWLDDPALRGVRDAKGLAELPEEERERWIKLWRDVRDLVRPAEKK
jgi:eukaryotic-like serine/threonine-protein kinase